MRKGIILLLIVYYSVVLNWGLIFTRIIRSYPGLMSLGESVFYISVSLSIITGSYFIGKTERYLSIIDVWAIFSFSLATSIALHIYDSSLFFFQVALAGAFQGLLILSSFLHFSRLTMIHERGRIGGLIVSGSLIFASAITSISLSDDPRQLMFLFIALSLLPAILMRLGLKNEELAPPIPIGGKHNLTKNFLYYLVPWTLYSFVNALPAHYITLMFVDVFKEIYNVLIIFSYLMPCVGAIIGGVIADHYGRKISMALALSLYGIGSAFSGLILLKVESILLIYLLIAINYLSWGFFFVLYFFVIWSDFVSTSGSSLYLIGMAVYPLSLGLIPFAPEKTFIPMVYLALLSCVIIFSSNVPLIWARELLSSDLKKKVNLIVYLENVKKLIKGSS